jgi:hypothetical protein
MMNGIVMHGIVTHGKVGHLCLAPDRDHSHHELHAGAAAARAG